MRTGYPAVRHQPFSGDYALDASTRQRSNPAPQYTPRTTADTEEQFLDPGMPRGPRTAEGCAKIPEFLGHAPWGEQREGLIATQSELEVFLNTHNLICHLVCHLLTEKLESLPREAIPMAESKILLQMHRNIQYSILRNWPQEWLRPETSTAGFDDIISEIAQFESQGLGFLHTLKFTLLGLYDSLSSTREMEFAASHPYLAPLLDVRPIAWVQFILPAELTHSHLKLIILHETFGLLCEIAEIFLFTPQPEGFIISHGHLEIPNIDLMMSPQHHLILIKTPHYLSQLIQAALAPHFPTRRPALDTLVTLPELGTEPYAATVVAIEQNHWSTEWAYMIRLEKKGTPPQLIMTVLDRGDLNPHDTSICISSKAMELKNGETAFFFNQFERPIRLTIIEQKTPGFHLTVRNSFQPTPYDDILIRPIEIVQLFTVHMHHIHTATTRAETTLVLISKALMNWGLRTHGTLSPPAWMTKQP